MGSHKTAKEILSELNLDRQHQELLQCKEKERSQTVKLAKKEDELVVQELYKKGISINSIYDLVNNRNSYKEAIPILIHLVESEKLTNPRILEGVVRSLTIKDAKGKANKSLLSLFGRIDKTNESLLWAIGNAFSVIIDYEDTQEVLNIVRDKEYGTSRQMFIIALGKLDKKLVEDDLINLLNDEDVSVHAIEALGKLKSQKAKVKISRMLNHNKSLIRKEAKKALKKIG